MSRVVVPWLYGRTRVAPHRKSPQQQGVPTVVAIGQRPKTTRPQNTVCHPDNDQGFLAERRPDPRLVRLSKPLRQTCWAPTPVATVSGRYDPLVAKSVDLSMPQVMMRWRLCSAQKPDRQVVHGHQGWEWAHPERARCWRHRAAPIIKTRRIAFVFVIGPADQMRLDVQRGHRGEAL